MLDFNGIYTAKLCRCSSFTGNSWSSIMVSGRKSFHLPLKESSFHSASGKVHASSWFTELRGFRPNSDVEVWNQRLAIGGVALWCCDIIEYWFWCDYVHQCGIPKLSQRRRCSREHQPAGYWAGFGNILGLWWRNSASCPSMTNHQYPSRTNNNMTTTNKKQHQSIISNQKQHSSIISES